MSVRIGSKFSATAMFARYRTVCHCENKDDEFIMFTRIGRGTKRFLINNVLWGLMDTDSAFDVGDVITDDNGTMYFLVAKTNSMQGDKGEFYKTNCTIDIVDVKKNYNEYGEQLDNSEITRYKDYPVVYEDVSAHMHLFDYGLLPTTTRRFIVPSCTVVNVGDRIVLNGENSRVDSINKSDFQPFLYLQCSKDNRV